MDLCFFETYKPLVELSWRGGLSKDKKDRYWERTKTFKVIQHDDEEEIAYFFVQRKIFLLYMTHNKYRNWI